MHLIPSEGYRVGLGRGPHPLGLYGGGSFSRLPVPEVVLPPPFLQALVRASTHPCRILLRLRILYGPYWRLWYVLIL